MSTAPAADVNAVAKQLFAYATAALHGTTLAGTASDIWKNAAGLALQRAMRRQHQGWARLPVLPAAVPGALSALLNYMFPPDAEPASAGAAAPPPLAVATAPASDQVAFDAASLAALRELASSNAAVTSKPDPIVLGHSKVEDGGALRRPGFFSVGDVTAFDEHEGRFIALAGLPKGNDLAFTKALRELPVSARNLLAVPVNPADMAKNQRLHVRKVLHERQTSVAGNIILQGTALCRASAKQRRSVRRTVSGRWRCATRSRGT